MKNKGYLLFSILLIISIIHSPVIQADFKIIINFDDGYDGVFINAFPIMQEYNVPGVVFVITKQLNKKNHLSIDQLKILRDSNWEIGSHSICHYDLSKIIPSVLEHEIKGSKKHLEDLKLIDNSYSSFSSPNTKWNTEIENLVSTTYHLARSKKLHIFKDDIMYVEDTVYKVVVKSTTNRHVKYWIDEAIEKDQPLILVFHEIATGGNDLFYSPEKFKDLIKIISEYKITTFRDYYFSK